MIQRGSNQVSNAAPEVVDVPTVAGVDFERLSSGLGGGT